MRRLIVLVVLAMAVVAVAQSEGGRKPAGVDIGKKESSSGPDKNLAGDLTRKKSDRGEAAPSLKYDEFRVGVEVQMAEKREQQIRDLKKIIELTEDKQEKPKLLFRMGELYWEESKHWFFQANRKDDELIQALNRKDTAAQERAKAEKETLIAKSKDYAKLATDQYTEIVQRFKDFERTDEVLYFLGHNLMETGEERKSLVAFKRLIEKYPKSRYISDAHLAFGEYYFNGSKGKREMLEKALDAYKKAAADPENAVYGFALYKQGWCYFNLADYPQAMNMFKSVVLYGQIAGQQTVEGTDKKGKGGRAGLVREARADYVRSWARSGGSPTEARAEFAKLTDKPDERFIMMKQLANLYYEDGKDKEAALAFNMLIKEKPCSPEAPGFQAKIVDCVLRAGNKQMTVAQVRQMVKITDEVGNKCNLQKDEKSMQALKEAKELAERTISNLAVNWHTEARKTRDEPTYAFANEVYADYLTLFPDNPKSYDLRFFWAELLNDNLQKYDMAAEQYAKVFQQDIACVEKGGKALSKAASRAEKKKGKKGKKGAEEKEEEKKDEKEGEGEQQADGQGKQPACKVGRFMVNAAYNSILAYDEVVKKALADGKIKTEAASDPNKKLNFPPEKKALLDACERYIKYLPEGEKRVEIAFKAARIYYDHNHLDEAINRFNELALKYPDYKFENGDCAGEVAANLTLDAVINIQKDTLRGNGMARKFYAEERIFQCKPSFKPELAALIEKTAFAMVSQFEANKEYGRAAEAYMSFVQEFPHSEIADQALFNAAIDFFNGKQLDKAIETRKRLLTQYTRSKYVPQTLFALAEGYEAIADFEAAADFYEKYTGGYQKGSAGGGKAKAAPKKGHKKGGKDDGKDDRTQVWDESKAQVALFNAGVFREGLNQYGRALKDRETYLDLWPDSKDAEAVFLSIADLHEKNGSYAKASRQMEEYEKKFQKDPNKVLTAEGRIARIYEERQKNPKAARKVYERILDYHEKLPKKTKAALEITALDAVGRAHFVTSEDQYKKFVALRLKWSRLANVGEFKTSVQEKGKALAEIQKLYTVTVGFKSADPAICALYKIGMAYDNFIHAMMNPPIPKGMTDDLLAEFKPQMEQQVEQLQLRGKAAEAFAAAVGKSQELDVYNRCTTQALEQLRTVYAPDKFPRMGEDVLELKGDFKQMAVGSGLLAALQPIPTVSAEKAQAVNERTREVGKNTADLDTTHAKDLDRELKSSPPPSSTGTNPAAKKPPAQPSEEPNDEPL